MTQKPNPFWSKVPNKGTYWVIAYDRTIKSQPDLVVYGFPHSREASDRTLNNRALNCYPPRSFNKLRIDRPIYRIKVTIKSRQK